MLSSDSRLQLERILKRIASGKEVSLGERIYVDKFADQNQTVSNWLKRARRLQQQGGSHNDIDHLLTALDIGSADPNANYNPKEDDLGDWFGGAPSWLVRS